MKRARLEEAQTIPRDYGKMIMLAGGTNLHAMNSDLRILYIRAGASTSKHYHVKSESVFHVLRGELRMEVDGASNGLSEGDTIVIEPNETHVLRNVGEDEAVVIESMSPGFSKKDIFYLDDV